jgi:hypothetical protein
MADANANSESDTIEISPSVRDIYLSSSIAVTGDVTVNGGGATIRGSKVTRLFEISGGTAKFNRLTFTDGYPLSESGGAVYIDASASTAEFVNCTFWGNRAGRSGAAVYVYGAGYRPVTFTNCTITNNEAAENGGGVTVAGGVALFTASIVTGNKAPVDADVHTEGGGLVSNTGRYNVVGQTNAPFASAGYNDNNVSVPASDVFKTPDKLTTVDGVQVAELLSATSNVALDKIPAASALGLSLPNEDERGALRPQMGGYDAGAYELAPVALTGVELRGPSYIEKLTSERYTAALTPEGATLDVRGYPGGLEWSAVNPSDGNVISVDGEGKVTALAVGVATLKVTAHGWDSSGSPIVRESSKVITVGNVAVESPKVSVSITNKKTSLAVDEQHTLRADVTVTPADTPYTISFESVNPTIATVTQTAPNALTAIVKGRYPGETMVNVVVRASNSKGTGESSDGYMLTVSETAKGGGGGGGCQMGSGALLTGLALAGILILGKENRYD